MNSSKIPDITPLARDLRAGHRAALARAITLIESRRSDHQAAGRELVQALLPETGRAIRVGITGSPGVGKSTFIETFGHLLGEVIRRVTGQDVIRVGTPVANRRRVELGGAFATIARKGDARGGAVLVKTLDRRGGQAGRLSKRSRHPAVSRARGGGDRHYGTFDPDPGEEPHAHR